ncbi:MAG: prepilin-type N-terminal cleavage/methylation domain-containing protein [bacterium]
MKRKVKKSRKGFSLHEILTVIVIIGVLAASTMVYIGSVRASIRDTQRVNDVGAIYSALEMYHKDNGVYPSNLTPGEPIASNGKIYLASIPSNPLPNDDGDCDPDTDYVYELSNTGVSYSLTYCLGNGRGNINPGINKANPSTTACKPNCYERECGDSCVGVCGICSSGDVVTDWMSPASAIQEDSSVPCLIHYSWDGEETSPENVASNDGLYSKSKATSYTATTYYLKASNFNFSIPDGANIDGIELEIEKIAFVPSTSWGIWSCSQSVGFKDREVRIIKSTGELGAENKKSLVSWPNQSQPDVYVSYGGASDTWSETWTPADINSANFGVALIGDTGGGVGGATIGVDHMRIKVYYTVSGGKPYCLNGICVECRDSEDCLPGETCESSECI